MAFSLTYILYTTHCLLFSPRVIIHAQSFSELRSALLSPLRVRLGIIFMSIPYYTVCVCCAVLCCAGAAIEKSSPSIYLNKKKKNLLSLFSSHIILMRPPLVPYNPVITLTWTFSFFGFLFSPSTPVILRLLTSFSFLFLNSGGTSRLLIHTRIHRDAGGDDPQAPRVDISTAAAAPFLVLPAVASLFL
jgi:hypothetical protein